jgi:circadian clock protein KaiB
MLKDVSPWVYELTIIDVLQQPDIAEQAGIMATPTLIKSTPLPPRRVVGDLSDPQILAYLDLS